MATSSRFQIRFLAMPILAGLFFAGCGSGANVDAGANALSGPSRDPELLTATQEFGPLVVHAGEVEGIADWVPWSSWWFPTRDKFIFDGSNSPLAKYDVVSRKIFQKESAAAKYEYENLYDEFSVSWEGLCHAWALASIVEPEPRKPREVAGVTFSVGDQKALLLKIYEDVEGPRQFGQRYNGMHRDEVFDDIYPDQLHKIVEVELVRNKRPIIIDKDPGPAVWNTPIFQVVIHMETDPSNPNVMHTRMGLLGAGAAISANDMNKTGTRSVAFEYTYDLYGQPQPDGSFLVQYGLWTGDSANYHPDFATIVPTQASDIKHRSRNKQLEQAVVEKILGKN